MKNYSRFDLYIPANKRTWWDKLKAAFIQSNKNMSAYIIKLIEQDLEKDNKTGLEDYTI